MKSPLVLLGFLSFALIGCDSVSDAAGSVRNKLTAHEQPRTQVFAADQRATFEAARVALGASGYRLVRGGAAQGEMEAMSSLLNDGSRGTRQITLKARFGLAAAGGTEVQLWLKEAVELESNRASGRATERAIRNPALYEVFFRDMQVALTGKKGP